jgi:hypothetical protein
MAYDASRKLRRAQIVNVVSGIAVMVLFCLGKIPDERKTAMYFALAWCFVVAPIALELLIRAYRSKKSAKID